MGIMKRSLIFLILFCFLFSQLAFAKEVAPPETLDKNTEVTIYSVKKRHDFVAVEIGFTNKTNHYVLFTPTEIYLNDPQKYSVSPLPFDDLNELRVKETHYSLIPLGVAIALGISGAAVHNHDAGEALGLAALGMGGAFVISAILEDKANNNQLVTFENNSLRTITKLPPGVTLGGFLYFPKVKKPTSITIVVETSKGVFEKKNIPITKGR